MLEKVTISTDPRVDAYYGICDKCGHRWLVRKKQLPNRCPKLGCRHRLDGIPREPIKIVADITFPKCIHCGIEWALRKSKKPSYCPTPGCGTRDWYKEKIDRRLSRELYHT
jgi:predicted Zn-ribbon and HTH transcriptional regulator